MSQTGHITIKNSEFTHRVTEKWVPEKVIFTEGTVEGKNQEVKFYGSHFYETVT